MRKLTPVTEAATRLINAFLAEEDSIEGTNDVSTMIDGSLDLAARLEEMLNKLNSKIEDSAVKAQCSKAINACKDVITNITGVRDNYSEEPVDMNLDTPDVDLE